MYKHELETRASGGTYTDEDGQAWTINIEVNYIEGGSQDFADGDNNLDISNIYEGGRSKVDGGEKPIMEKTASGYKATGEWDYNTTGNGGTMRGGEGNIRYGYTSYHETLHFLGLSDRYGGSGETVQPGYETDMMSGGGTNMHQNHWNNWCKSILNNGKPNFILKHKVDFTGDKNMKYYKPENYPTKRGTR